ncbi:MAG: uroporphyrinogen decarboxylase family protein, partial [Atribacter sp.]
YTQALRDAGADMIMVLEPTAVIFGPDQFRQNLTSLYREMVGIFDDIEIILHVCGDSTHLLKVMADTGVAGLSLDSMVDLKKAAEIVGPQVMLIGNLSPIEMLTANPNEVYIQTMEILEKTKSHPPFVLSTGCDLPQDVPLENIDAFIKAGKDWRQESVFKKVEAN